MPERQRKEDRPDVPALEAEIVRLNKIVQALMDRSESSTNVQDSDFGLFQATVMLQDQVRLHTEELEAALHDKESGEAGAPASAPADMQALRRTAALQIQLLELVVQQKDVGELIERVATILDMPVVLFDARGQVVSSSTGAASSPGFAPRLWAAYADPQGAPGPLGTIDVAGDRIFYRDVVVMNRVERVLAAVASPRQSTEFAGASLSFLQQLVTLDLLRRRDELRMRRRVRRGLLRDLLAGEGAPDELRIRLQEQGFDENSALRVVVVEPLPPRSRPGEAPSARATERLDSKVLSALDAVLSRRRVPFLSLTVGPEIVVLATLPDIETPAARSLLADLQEAATGAISSGQVAAGCSAPLAGVASAPRGLQQARAACIAARRAPSTGGTAAFDELSGHLRLLDGLDQKALADIVQRTFAPLLEYDEPHRASLYETLYTLFEHHRAVQETADALHIHRNTLQKRLAHVERLLGIDLDELDDVVDVQLGLRAADLLGRRLP
ncbi:MAG TPA: helix-turn-helix domain-containing protein [Thermoleophilia bacterium]|nr:helix-turn-helix domain-containing protein [Thermoleophilia bacterium]